LGDLTPRQQEAIAAMARAIANKLLHDPIVHLKQPSDGHAPAELARVAEALFGLQEATGRGEQVRAGL
ncbi:MAG: hypothetical protein N2439_09290, partial [Anaerolineae bacterium]|nr:hypothetical protein [Anaerolineae bacterium]